MSEDYSESPAAADASPETLDARDASPVAPVPFSLPRFIDTESALASEATPVHDFVDVAIEFGKKTFHVRGDLASTFSCGRVISLDETVDQPVRLKANGKVVAIGELITQGGAVGLRITELLHSSN